MTALSSLEITAEINLVLENIADMRDEDIVNLANTYAYQGFNIGEFLAGLKDKINDDETRKSAVTKLIILFLCRGNKINKILNKTTQVVRDEFFALQQILDIKQSITANSTNRTVTLARIAAAYPNVTVILAHKLRSITYPGESRLNLIANDLAALPKYLWTTTFFAVIPSSVRVNQAEKFFGYIKAGLLCTFHNSEVINTKKNEWRNKTFEQKIEIILTYAQAAYNSNALANAIRERTCTSIGINFSNALPAVISTLSTTWDQFTSNLDISVYFQ